MSGSSDSSFARKSESVASACLRSMSRWSGDLALGSDPHAHSANAAVASNTLRIPVFMSMTPIKLEHPLILVGDVVRRDTSGAAIEARRSKRVALLAPPQRLRYTPPAYEID